MIVIDLGCYGHSQYDSVTALIETYGPHILFGFDPLADDEVSRWMSGANTYDTIVVTRRLAAWTHDGDVAFTTDGTGSHIGGNETVPCFDFSTWLRTLPGEIIVKMDVEGAEYAIAWEMKRQGLDERVKLLLVERHGVDKWPELVCPVEEWWM